MRMPTKVPSPPPSREEIRGPWERGCAYARIKRPNPPSLLQTKDTEKLQPSNMISKLLYSMFLGKDTHRNRVFTRLS